MNTARSMSFRRTLVALAMTGLVVASVAIHSGPRVRGTGDTQGTPAYSDLLAQHQPADRAIVRIRRDRSRHRLWVLTLESVYIYDTAASTLLRRIQLPAWSVADFDYALPPDLVLDHRGTAFLSSNVEPRLLEMNASTSQMKEHRLRLISRRQSESGFGALQFAPDGALLAVGTTAGSRFRIDLRAGTAEEMR
jgi:hypothetical protein